MGSLFACENTGYYNPAAVQSWVITSDSTLDTIQNGTGIAALYFSDSGSFRVYYKDNHSRTQAVQYTKSSGLWSNGHYASQDEHMSFNVAAGSKSSDEITVLNPRYDDDCIEVMTWQDSSGNWEVTTVPIPLDLLNSTSGSTVTYYNATSDSPGDDWSTTFQYNETASPGYSLPAYHGASSRASVAYGSDSARSIFYIGTDKALHSIDEVSGAWQLASVQNTTFWPAASTISADMGVTFDAAEDHTWIYYYSAGSMWQLHRSGQAWQVASALDKTPPAAATSTVGTGGSTSTSTPEGSSAGEGLSSGAKAGIGAGVGGGALFVIAAIGAFFFFRRRRPRQNEQPEVPEGGVIDHQYGGELKQHPDGNAYAPVYEMLQDERPHEMTHREIPHELSGDTRVGELPSELPGTQPGRPI